MVLACVITTTGVQSLTCNVLRHLLDQCHDRVTTTGVQSLTCNSDFAADVRASIQSNYGGPRIIRVNREILGRISVALNRPIAAKCLGGGLFEVSAFEFDEYVRAEYVRVAARKQNR